MNFVDLAVLTIHDVKNRLTLVAHDAERRGDARTLHGVLDASATLTRLLAYYKAESGALTVNIDARVPADLVNELVADVAHQTDLQVLAGETLSQTLCFYDEALVRMVLLDAVYNALRHAKSQVLISANDADHGVLFRVSDDGPGYPPSLLGKPLVMQSLSAEGTGLGLYLAQRVALLHTNRDRHGQVDLRNDGGAVFELFLPR